MTGTRVPRNQSQPVRRAGKRRARPNAASERSAGGRPPGDRLRRGGVEDGQVRRPEGLQQVEGVGPGGVGQAHPDGELGQAGDRAAAALGQHGDHRRGGREGEQRDLLAQQPGEIGRAPQAPARPPVEQQQREREGDRHRLGRQGQGEGADHRQVPRRRRHPQPQQPRAHGRRPEEAAQDVLAFGRPGNRLDVLGVDQEEGGGQEARRGRAGQDTQHEEEEDAGRCVDEGAGQVVPPGPPAEDLRVEHVR